MTVRRSRYNLDLPDSVYTELKAVANAHQRTVSQLVRRYVTLGLLIESRPGIQIILSGPGDVEREVILV